MYIRLVKTYLFELTLFILFLIFSFWLMFATFSYKNGTMFIATKAWSDFANHIPLIRSFSFGSNFPPQDPLFAGEPIHYHFLFYQFVGLLEKAGIRIDYAFNIPSALGFFALLVMLYFFGKKLFDSRAVGILSVLFFLCNGSLSFLEFFKKHSVSITTAKDIITNTTFPSFGPYDQKIVSAFWNLNIYTNQRHLAAAFALGLGMVYVVFKRIKNQELRIKENNDNKVHNSYFIIFNSILLGILLGLSFFFHLAVFLMICIVLACLFVYFKELRLSIFIILLIAGILAVPQYLYLKSGGGGYGLRFVPGYLVFDHLTVANFFIYWFYNLGLHFILIPIGFIIAPKKVKKLFIAFFTLFIIGNLFQFAPEMAENHKFFNFFLLFGSMLSAYVLVTMWKKTIFARIPVIIITFFLILSGIIDFFPIYNDGKLSLQDYPANKDIVWVMRNTPANAVFLNTSYLYDTANLAGRKIFLGWPYFPWSAGFDTTTRDQQIKQFFSLKNTQDICAFLRKNNLNYVSLTNPTTDFPYDPQFWQTHFSPAYTNSNTHLTLYRTTDICRN